ncbi:calcium-binding protein [Crossiella sp. NPDC003009]
MRNRNLCALAFAGALAASGFIGVGTASAAVNCTIGPGVTQTDTTVTGSGGNDTIDCTSANPAKTILGNGGNDTITGTVYHDTISGGDGDDTLTGGVGDDSLYGDLGIDTLNGSAGNDTLSGPGTDVAQDTLNGGDNTDSCGPVGVPPDLRSSCES